MADTTQKTEAQKATDQFKAKGTFEAELEAQKQTAEEARQAAIADQEKKGLIHGIPKDEYQKLDLLGQKRAEMNDPNSNLRNQITNEDVIDFQILSNTNAYTIEAMTNKTIAELTKRADELGVSLKGAAANDGGPR